MSENVENLEIVYSMPKPKDASEGYIQVDAKKIDAEKKNSKAGSIWYDFGKNLADMTKKFGENVVFSSARAHMKVKLQAAMRSYLISGNSLEELAQKYKPGVALERRPIDMKSATENYFSSLSEKEQDALIAKLMETKSK